MVIAATTNDARLKIEGKLAKWELSRMRKSDMYVRLKQFYATALPFVNQLLPLGFTQGEIDNLDTETTRLMNEKPTN